MSEEDKLKQAYQRGKLTSLLELGWILFGFLIGTAFALIWCYIKW